MRIRASMEMDVVEFSTWIQNGGADLPLPLMAGAIAHAPVDIEALARSGEQRDGSPSTWINPVERSADRATREVLSVVARVFAEPRDALVLPHDHVGSELPRLVVGFIRGDEAVVLTDDPAGVVVQIVGPSDVAQAAVNLLPPMASCAIRSITVPEKSLEALGSLPKTASRDDVLRAATALGVPADEWWAAVHVSRNASAWGMIGAQLLQDGAIVGDCFGGNWFQSDSGAVVQRRIDDAKYILEPATITSLAKAAADCLDSLHLNTARQAG